VSENVFELLEGVEIVFPAAVIDAPGPSRQATLQLRFSCAGGVPEGEDRDRVIGDVVVVDVVTGALHGEPPSASPPDVYPNADSWILRDQRDDFVYLLVKY
jgi:hypothetical protein